MKDRLDFIGDIHGCIEELEQLLGKLGYHQSNSGHWLHKDERKIVFIGDITDRGPGSLAVIKLVCALVDQGIAYYIPGNHCDKLYRYMLGRPVQVRNGLETTVAELEGLRSIERHRIEELFMKLFELAPLYLHFKESKIAAAHAGIRRKDLGKLGKAVRAFVLYGDVEPQKRADTPLQPPKRRDWAKFEEKRHPWIIYGHTPVAKPRELNQTINIDTGCVFGGALTALRYPEFTYIQVPSLQPFRRDKFHAYD